MKVGIDLTALLPKWTGIDNYMIGLVTHLAKLDEVNRYYLFVNREDREVFAGWLPPNFRLVPASLRPRPVRLAFQQALLPLASTRLDVVHSPAFLMPVVRGSARHLLTIVDLTFFSMPEHHGALHRSAPFRRAVLSAMRRADRITVPAAAVKRDVLERVPEVRPERVDVIGYGVGEQFRPHPADEIAPVLERLGLPANYMLYLGTVEPRKNLETLLEAYARLLRRGDTGTHLVIAGKLGWGYEGLLRRLEQPDIRGMVHLPGYVTAADLPSLYAGARLFVYPSWAEGFGFPPLEAMASGVPVIAGRTSSLAENLDGAAELVAPGDATGLSSAMGTLLRNEARRETLRAAGTKRAAEFRWDESARRSIALYEELAASSIRRPLPADS